MLRILTMNVHKGFGFLNRRFILHELREAVHSVAADIVFLALPHGQSGQYTDALGDAALVIDAGADHRLESAADWDTFYGGDFHEPWVYGVPELLTGGVKQRERLVGASRIAAPGCNASTVSLSLAPGVAAGTST